MTKKYRALQFLSFLPTYRQRNLFLLGVGVFALLLIYLVSIRQTLGLYRTYRVNRAAIARAASAPGEIARLEAQVAALQQNGLKVYDQENLLVEVTRFCREHELLITTFPSSDRVVENGYPIITNTLEVQGGYKDMVRLVHLLEQRERLGSVGSLKFYTQKDRISKKTYLRLSIVLRNLAA